MKTKLLYFILLFFATQNCIGQETIKKDSIIDRYNTERRDHYAKTHLNGSVKSIKEIGYDLIEDQGRYRRGTKKQYLHGMSYLRRGLHSAFTLFDKSGNLLETNNFDDEGNLKKLKEYEWNSSGNLTKIIFHSHSEPFDSINYSYNFKDKEVYETAFYRARPRFYNVDSVLALMKPNLDQVKDLKVRHQMDSIHKDIVLKNANFYNNNPQPASRKFISKYDNNGQLLEKYYYDTSNVKTIIMKFSVKYEDGKITELLNKSYPEGTFGEVYIYDERGNQIENTFIEHDGSKGRVFAKEYDKNNNVVKEQTLSSNPKLLQAETIKEYDSNNNLIKSTLSSSKGKIYAHTFKYDHNNNVIEEYTSDGHLKYEYKYDEEKNWVSKKRFKFNSKDGLFIPVSIIEREISYH